MKSTPCKILQETILNKRNQSPLLARKPTAPSMDSLYSKKSTSKHSPFSKLQYSMAEMEQSTNSDFKRGQTKRKQSRDELLETQKFANRTTHLPSIDFLDNPSGDFRHCKRELNEAMKQTEKLRQEIEELKEAIQAKSDHLVLLRKQIHEQSIQSYLSDTDGFCIQEENASSLEILQLEHHLEEKQEQLEKIERKIEELKESAIQHEGNMSHVTPTFNTRLVSRTDIVDFPRTMEHLPKHSTEEPQSTERASTSYYWEELCEFFHDSLQKLLKLPESSMFSHPHSLLSLFKERRASWEHVHQCLGYLKMAGTSPCQEIIEVSPITESEPSELQTNVIKRCITVYNFLAEKKNWPQWKLSEFHNPWERMDEFTKRVRSYLRESEKQNLKSIRSKRAKQNFLGYVEKEVAELTKSWNLMEREKTNLNKMLKKMMANKEQFYKTQSSTSPSTNGMSQLQDEIKELQQKKTETLSEIETLLIKQREVEEAIYSRKEEHDKIMFNYEQEIESQKQVLDSLRGSITQLQNEYEIEQIRGSYQKNLSFPKKLNYSKVNEILVEEGRPDLLSEFPSNEYFLTQTQQKEDMGIPRASNPF